MKVPPRLLLATLPALLCCTECSEPPIQAPPARDAAPRPPARDRFGLTPQEAQLEVLKVGDRSIRLGSFAELLGPPPQRRFLPKEQRRRRVFLKELERTELLAIAAEARGALDEPRSHRARTQAMVSTLSQDLFGEGGELVQLVTDADVAQRYEAERSKYLTPDRRRASHILMGNEAKARHTLKQLQDASADPKLFADIARAQSRDNQTRKQGGSLGYFQRMPAPEAPADVVGRASYRPPVRVAQPLRDAAFDMTGVGTLYPEVLRSRDGFHILLLTGKRPPVGVKLRQVAASIRRRLTEERREQAMERYFGTLEEAAGVTYQLENLPLVRVRP